MQGKRVFYFKEEKTRAAETNPDNETKPKAINLNQSINWVVGVAFLLLRLSRDAKHKYLLDFYKKTHKWNKKPTKRPYT